MNRLIQELAKVCARDLLREKWLIAPSLRIGHQWVDCVTRVGAPVVNLRVKTLKRMALDLAGPEMARRGVTLVSRLGAAVLVDKILQSLRNDPDTYFASVYPGPTLTRSMATAVEALRLAGLGADRMHPGCFEVARKGADVAFVLAEFVRTLSERRLADYPEILSMAIDLVQCDPGAIGHDAIVLIPEDTDLSGLEKSLITAIPASRRENLPVDQPETGEVAPVETRCDVVLLRWILAPHRAPVARGDGTASIFAAVGESNEVREALRRCITGGYSLDTVELLHTDTQIYVPLVFETFLRVFPNAEPEDRALPVTFAEGIPTRYSRPGRALAAWIAWIREDHPQNTLARMIQEGLLELPAGFDGLTFTALASILKETYIGFGRGRYVSKLEEKIAALEQPSLSVTQPAPDGRDSDRPGHGPDLEKVSAAKAVLELVKALFQVTPPLGCPDRALLEGAERFLTECARSENELDNYSVQALLDRIREMSRWVGEAHGPRSLDMPRWLESLPAEVHVGGSGPRPGCLHVAHVLSGGHSGRKHTFVIGLDDGRFPGAGLNDPILLDDERGELSDELPKTKAQPRLKVEKFARLMARLGGSLTLGFSCYDLHEDRAMFPSSVVFSAYRILSNNREGDQGAMMRWLSPAASFSPLDSGGCLDETEWWLSVLCGREIRDVAELTAMHFPNLARGAAAATARASEEFTVFDGLLPEVPPSLDPISPSGPVMSATRLETIGRCPLAYYFKYVLNIEPPEEVSVDPNQWLDPFQFGELLHEVFYLFMTDLVDRGERPHFGRHWERLLDMLLKRAKEYESRFPPPGPSALHRQLRLLTQAALIFLVEEEVLSRHSRPRFLEASIGMRSYRQSGALDSLEPVSLLLQGGMRIRSRARIDRVDEIVGSEGPIFSIWDYKTGSSARYQHPDPFRQGRTVQPALYMEIVSAALRKKVSPAAAVSHFGYFFPGGRGRGLRILRRPDDLAHGKRIIENLCKTVSLGCFLATNNDREDCPFCDYIVICGDVEATAAASRRKLENPVNVDLDSIRELRNIGCQ